MAIREVLQIGHPALVAKNKLIKDSDSRKVKQVIKDLVDTMNKNDLVGLSAPQIGENLQIFITELRPTQFRKGNQIDELRIFINPKIITASKKEVIIYEGCGSVLNAQIFGPVSRSKEIVVEYSNLQGERIKLNCNGLLARVILHENDHLHGIQFIERISDYKKLLSREFYIQNIKNSSQQISNSQITIKRIKQ